MSHNGPSTISTKQHQEMDLSPESFPERVHNGLCFFLYAIKTREWELEEVISPWHGASDHLLSCSKAAFRKLAAIDFFGAFLALAGSSLLVV